MSWPIRWLHQPPRACVQSRGTLMGAGLARPRTGRDAGARGGAPGLADRRERSGPGRHPDARAVSLGCCDPIEADKPKDPLSSLPSHAHDPADEPPKCSGTAFGHLCLALPRVGARRLAVHLTNRPIRAPLPENVGQACRLTREISLPPEFDTRRYARARDELRYVVTARLSEPIEAPRPWHVPRMAYPRMGTLLLIGEASRTDADGSVAPRGPPKGRAQARWL
jgi:hypothetical protein